MQIIRMWLVLSALACALVYLGHRVVVDVRSGTCSPPHGIPVFDASRAMKGESTRDSIELNRGPEVQGEFRGDVHTLLYGPKPLEVTAHWSAIGPAAEFEKYAPRHVYAMYRNLKPARKQQAYTGRDFSAFLPEQVEAVGQTWSVDLRRLASFLSQFHHEPRMYLAAPGRRAGPDGGFAMLRAWSPTHLDIAFRIHAEFQLLPDEPFGEVRGAWYTPAAFVGRVLINRQTGTVDHFRLALPTDLPLNVQLTLGLPRNSTGHDIVRVDRMELVGGDGTLANRISWDEEIPAPDADLLLKRIFYKFMEVEWVPFERALALARDLHKPIVAVIPWGSLDDQSC